MPFHGHRRSFLDPRGRTYIRRDVQFGSGPAGRDLCEAVALARELGLHVAEEVTILAVETLTA